MREMKQIILSDAKTAISLLREKISEYRFTVDNNTRKSELDAVRRSAEELHQIIALIEHHGDTNFILNERAKVAREIDVANSRFDLWNKSVCPGHVDLAKRRSMFNGITNLPDMKSRANVLDRAISIIEIK